MTKKASFHVFINVWYKCVYIITINLRLTALVTVFCFANSLPLFAEKLSIKALSNYLDGIRTLQSKFTQINSDGTLSTGSLFIKRPGRIRFEYDYPSEALVLASAGQLAIFDPNGNSAPEIYPLSKTPLSLILAEKVELVKNGFVKSHGFDDGSTILTIHDPQHPEQGFMELIFTGPDPQLRQWVVKGQNGDKTVVVFNNMATDISLSDRLFNVLINWESRKEKSN